MFPTARRYLAGAFALAMLATFSACGSGNEAEPTQSPTASNTQDGGGETPIEMLKWKIGVMPCSSDCGFLRMADAKGFYEKHGVEVEFVELQSASQIYPALAAGEVDAIEQSPGGLFIAQHTGGLDAKIIGSSMQGMPYAIYAKKEFTDIKQLAGKSVGISSPTGLPALVAQLIFEDAGVDWSSIHPVNAGGNADRYRAVVAGTADSASSPADYVPQAEQDGVNVLALSSDVIPEYPRYMIIARNESLQQRPEAATRYMAGLIEGLRYAYDNPDEAKALAAEALKTTADDPMVTYMHDLIVDAKLVDPDGGIPLDKLEFQEKVLRMSGELTGDLDLSALVDDQFQKAALELLNK